jgi:hypothetical protein
MVVTLYTSFMIEVSYGNQRGPEFDNCFFQTAASVGSVVAIDHYTGAGATFYFTLEEG